MAEGSQALEVEEMGQECPPAETQRRAISEEMNIGSLERGLCLGGGALLALYGLRGSIKSLAATALGGVLIYRGVTGQSQLYRKLGVTTVLPRLGRHARPRDFFERGVHVEHAFTIMKSPGELYQFWRNFENLPRFMEHLDCVKVIDERRSHWVAKAPRIAGGTMEWDAELINDEPDALIAWRSLPGSDIAHAGSVRFIPAPGDQGTEVHAVIEYLPPAGQVGRLIARLLGEAPEQKVKEDLRRFKQIMEAGESPTTQGQPRGTCAGSGERQQGR